MKKRNILYSILLSLFLLWGNESRAQFNPDNPPEPNLVTKVTTQVSTSGIAYVSGGGTYQPGTEVWMRTSSYNGTYVFDHWTLNGEYYSSQQNFSYVVTEYAANFVAHYQFTPTSPEEPSPIIRRRLYMNSKPKECCTFSRSSGERFLVGNQVYLCAYGNYGYEFLGWYDDTTLVSSQVGFYYTIPDKNAVLTARYQFNPTNPADPSNFYSTSCALSVAANNDEKGDVNISELTKGRALLGSTVTVTATPQEGYVFRGWFVNDKVVSTDAVYQFTATKDCDFVAQFFSPEEYPMGDANADGRNSVTDCVEVFKLLKGTPSTIFDRYASDVDKDGNITPTDAEKMLPLIIK